MNRPRAKDYVLPLEYIAALELYVNHLENKIRVCNRELIKQENECFQCPLREVEKKT